MELTQATAADLLAQLGPGDGYMHLPGDLAPRALTDLLANRYGAPRTLVLDGFTARRSTRPAGRLSSYLSRTGL